jgi:hypothetical protein
MATAARHAVARKNPAFTDPANKHPSLTPQEFAEFMASLEEDAAFAEAAECNDCDLEYND